MRSLLVAAIVLGAGAACKAPQLDDEARYATDPTFRRALLTETLLGESHYVKVRLQHYASGDALDWDRHDEWNPQRLDGPLETLGHDAFFRYPAQIAPEGASLTAIPFGVAVEVGGPRPLVALTCATCHTRRQADGSLTVGASNRDFDFGALLAASSNDPEFARTRRAWGPGKVDVSSRDGTEPVAIPDLRPVRYQTHLQYAGAVAQTRLVALALRIETLIITAHGGALRPPRKLTLALARYVWSLAPPLPQSSHRSSRGAAVFAQYCAGCHRGAERSGPPVFVERVGTDPTAARSSWRGTGKYRVPSLVGVGDRTPLLHDGSVEDLTGLLDPARSGGHAFTVGINDTDRAALREFLDAH